MKYDKKRENRCESIRPLACIPRNNYLRAHIPPFLMGQGIELTGIVASKFPLKSCPQQIYVFSIQHFQLRYKTWLDPLTVAHYLVTQATTARRYTPSPAHSRHTPSHITTSSSPRGPHGNEQTRKKTARRGMTQRRYPSSHILRRFK